jgi:hypothetical protein
VRRARFRLIAATDVAVALLVAGCGAGKTHVGSVVAAPTTKPTAARTTKHSGRNDYPAHFEAAFVDGCAEDTTRKYCACVLAYLEAHVTYRVVASEFMQSRFLSSSAYRRGVRACRHA